MQTEKGNSQYKRGGGVLHRECETVQIDKKKNCQEGKSSFLSGISENKTTT